MKTKEDYIKFLSDVRDASGIESLTPDDIVLVRMDDLSYDGDVKPSSEKGIHAQCYLLRKDCNFVIHTHQSNASIISALGSDINNVEGKARELIGDNVPLASYGLPGTGKLRKGVVNALQRSDSKAVIMKHHGAVCLGKDYDEAFEIASQLEIVCQKEVFNRYKALTNKTAESFRDICDYVADLKKRAEAPAPQLTAYDSSRVGNVVKLNNKESFYQTHITFNFSPIITFLRTFFVSNSPTVRLLATS